VYWKLVLAGVQHRRIRVAMSGILIAITITPVFLAVGLGRYGSAAATSSASAVATIALPPDSASPTLRPAIRLFIAVFLTTCVAITLLSMWANVRHRKREIRVLRFLGASKSLVIAIVFTEASVIGFGGATLAILISQSVVVWLNFESGAAPPYSIGFWWCLEMCCLVIGAASLAERFRSQFR
jgi:hypothetical protein